jgi:nucleoside-diphosphate-sugar epimerase
LIAGACGAIGRIVGPYLRDRGHHVSGMDLLSETPPGFDSYRSGNISDQVFMLEFLKDSDVVIHLAAPPDDADFEDARSFLFLINDHVVEADRYTKLTSGEKGVY